MQKRAPGPMETERPTESSGPNKGKEPGSEIWQMWAPSLLPLSSVTLGWVPDSQGSVSRLGKDTKYLPHGTGESGGEVWSVTGTQ